MANAVSNVDIPIVNAGSGYGMQYPSNINAYLAGGTLQLTFNLKFTGTITQVQVMSGGAVIETWVRNGVSNTTHFSFSTNGNTQVVVTPTNTAIGNDYNLRFSVTEGASSNTVDYSPIDVETGCIIHMDKLQVWMSTPDNGQTFTWSPQGPWTMHSNNTILVSSASCPPGTVMNSITIYNNKVVGGVDQKDLSSPVGTSNYSAGATTTIGPYQVTWQSNDLIVLKDTTTTTGKYWFGVGLTGPNRESWVADPELINQGGKGGIGVGN